MITYSFPTAHQSTVDADVAAVASSCHTFKLAVIVVGDVIVNIKGSPLPVPGLVISVARTYVEVVNVGVTTVVPVNVAEPQEISRAEEA